MKAVLVNEFGGPEVLTIEEVAKPVPAADEILINIYASGVNPADWIVRNGGNDFLRPVLKLPLILGWDAAGLVEEVGSDVKDFKIGDEVFGVPNFPGNGSYAEYVAAKASQFAIKPKNLSFVEASGVPLAGLVAWTALFDHGKLQAGQHVFIHGASGGVGSFAVQFAKAKGAYVIASASESNLEFLKEIGADEVIDYKAQNFETLLEDVDLAFDASPQRNDNERLKFVKIIKQNGFYVSTNLDFPFSEEVNREFETKNITRELDYTQLRKDWLEEIGTLIEEGKVKVFISKVYPLEQVADAHRESESWHVRGKLVLEVQKEK